MARPGFQPLVEPRLNLAGWPFGLPFWPLEAAFGPVAAWNTLLLTCVVIAGIATYGWLRLLKLPPAAAILGRLAFAIAPCRLADLGTCSAGSPCSSPSLSMPSSVRGRPPRGLPRTRQGFGALLPSLSLPLSGQVHLAVGALCPSASPMRLLAAARQRSAGPSQPASSEAAWESRSARP